MSFDLFWSKYPRKVSKGTARKAWAKLTPEQIEKVLGVIDEHLHYWQVTGTEIQWIPYPASWLNGERYDDQLIVPEPQKTKSSTLDKLIGGHHGRTYTSESVGAAVIQAFPQLVRKQV